MRITIFGLGAMACLFGSRLAPQAEVALVGHWRAQIEALNTAPLRIAYPNGREERVRLRATDDPDSLPPADVVLILTKSRGTEDAARQAASVLRPDGLAITLQNGIGNLEIIAAQVGAGRATLGVTAQGAALTGPGELRYGGTGVTHLATRPEIDARVRAAADLFNRCGLETQVASNVDTLVWGKLAVNAGINPLSALLRVPNGALLESDSARGLMRAAADEVAALAAAPGIPLPFESAAARCEEVARLTAHNRSSMLQDALRGVETEIEVICGAVVRKGEEMGVPTPVNAALYRMVRALEETYHVVRDKFLK
jgi:2-dehydropantoate 2-reductase